MAMIKTQIYFPAEELAALHRQARKKKKPVAELVRQAVREVFLQAPVAGPVAIWNGPFRGASLDHDDAFDERE